MGAPIALVWPGVFAEVPLLNCECLSGCRLKKRDKEDISLHIPWCWCNSQFALSLVSLNRSWHHCFNILFPNFSVWCYKFPPNYYYSSISGISIFLFHLHSVKKKNLLIPILIFPVENGEEKGSLPCCSPWSCKELDMTEWLNNNNIFPLIHMWCSFRCVVFIFQTL